MPNELQPMRMLVISAETAVSPTFPEAYFWKPPEFRKDAQMALVSELYVAVRTRSTSEGWHSEILPTAGDPQLLFPDDEIVTDIGEVVEA